MDNSNRLSEDPILVSNPSKGPSPDKEQPAIGRPPVTADNMEDEDFDCFASRLSEDPVLVSAPAEESSSDKVQLPIRRRPIIDVESDDESWDEVINASTSTAGSRGEDSDKFAVPSKNHSVPSTDKSNRGSGHGSSARSSVPPRGLSRTSSGTSRLLVTKKDHVPASKQTSYKSMEPEERTIQDSWARTQISAGGICPHGWTYKRVDVGYQCLGGHHLITDELLAEGEGGIYYLPNTYIEEPWEGPYYAEHWANEKKMGR